MYTFVDGDIIWVGWHSFLNRKVSHLPLTLRGVMPTLRVPYPFIFVQSPGLDLMVGLLVFQGKGIWWREIQCNLIRTGAGELINPLSHTKVAACIVWWRVYFAVVSSPDPTLEEGKGSGDIWALSWFLQAQHSYFYRGGTKSRNGEMRNEKLEMRKWKWSAHARCEAR